MLDTPLQYREYAPPFYLQGYVKGFWTLERRAFPAEDIKFSPVPDGFPGLIFQVNEAPGFYDTAKNAMPTAFLFGQTITRKKMILAGEVAAIGVYFYPSAIKTIFNLDAFEVADDCLAFELISKADYEQLLHQIQPLPTTQQRIQVLAEYFYHLIAINKKNPQVVDIAIAKIFSAKGLIGVNEILKELNISERSLERYFKQFVGVSPQKFIRICRFQTALQKIKTADYQKLTDVAYDLGYADQAHFIREFKAFFGTAPMQLHKNQPDFLSDLQIFSK